MSQSWAKKTTGGGGGSVTSAAYISLVNRVSVNSAQTTSIANAVSVLSNTLSAETASRISADNALSNAISALSTVVSNVASNVAVISLAVSALTSAVDVVSAAAASKNQIVSIANQGSVFVTNPDKIDFTGNGVSAFLSGSTTKVNISVVAAIQSVTSAEYTSLVNRVSGNSTQMTSADNALSDAISVETAARISADTALSNAISALSVVVSNQASAIVANSADVTSLKNRVSANSVQMTSADDAISNAVSIVSAAQAVTSAAVTSLNQVVSALSANIADISANISAISTRLSALSTTVATNSAQMTSADNALSNAISVETASRISADNALSNAISSLSVIVSNQGSAIGANSADVTSLKNRVSANSAQMISADNALSNAISIVSAAQAVTSAAVTSVNNRVSAISTDVTSLQNVTSNLVSEIARISLNVSTISTALSNAVSAIQANSADFTSFKQSINNIGDVSTSSPTSAQVLAYVSATGQWTNQTFTGGSGSVTSAEYLSLVNRVSGNSTQMTSADDALSQALSVLSAVVITKNRIISIYNQGVEFFKDPERLDFTGNAVSAFLSGSTVKINISTTGGGGSVTSAEYLSLVERVSALSTQMTSVDDNLSRAISAVSTAQAVTSAAVTSVNQVVSALSANVATISTNVSAISTRLSALSTQVATNSAQMTSANNAISNAVSIVSAAQAVTSAAVTSVNTVLSNTRSSLSALSADVTSVKSVVGTKNPIITIRNQGSNTTSSPTTIDFIGAGVSTYLSTGVVKVKVVSAGGGGGGSVTSAAYNSLVNRVSTNSAIMTSLVGTRVVVENIQNITTSTDVQMSGLSLTFDANATYDIEAQIVFDISAISATGYRMILVNSATTQRYAVGAWQYTSAMAASTGGANVVLVNHNWHGLSGAKLSVTSAGTAQINRVLLRGMIATSATGGSIGIAGAVTIGTVTMRIYYGSYFKATKLS
jgi:predicted  nucleic acid-binding Zn-ribbon protein